MKVEVIATYYQEEYLIPLFMMHYSPWADKVTLLTNKFSEGKIVEDERTAWINEAVVRSNADWVVVVDIDEFVFPKPVGSDARVTLSSEAGNVIKCAMHQVWRHRTDQDIDRMSPPILQRRHGELDLSGPYNGAYVKPCVFRPGTISVGIGAHSICSSRELVYGSSWSGAHWAKADPCFCVKRVIGMNRDRQSQYNIDRGFGWQHMTTEDKVLQMCNEHLDDPVVIA